MSAADGTTPGSTHSDHAAGETEDACGSFGPVQYSALAWFFAVVLIGLGLTYTLRATDGYNYATNGEYFDMQATRENRMAATSVHGDALDERAFGDVVTARRRIEGQ